jgi:hypothetical protein
VFKSGNLFGSNGGRRNLVSVAFGIDWMTRDERSNAIPPCYTEYIGKYLLQAALLDQGFIDFDKMEPLP